MVEFRLLGSVAALVDGSNVPLGGPKPRLLLAALVLARGRSVPGSRLVDLLWDDDPPRSATGLLHTYVSGLRRALGPDVIRRDPAGYRVDIEAGVVDVHEFDRLAADASLAAERGEHERARDLCVAAESWWRGDALAGLGGAFAAAEAERLRDARLAVVQVRVAALAALGADEALVGELTALVAEHPFHERLRASLVAALGRTGRRSDAMACFHEARELLADELGVEPGAELREAYRALLVEEEAPPALVPDQLPEDIPDFVGRRDELLRIHGGARVVVVSGQPGAGKTTLAVRGVRTAPTAFPGGRLYVDLRGSRQPLDPFDGLGRFLRALGVAAAAVPSRLDERVGQYRTITAARGVVVVLDDAATERQVRPLLPGGERSRCVITTRRRLSALESAEHLGMPVLDGAEGLALLARAAEGRVAEDPNAAREVLRLCGHLPLAVRIVGARLAARPDRPLSAVVARLREQRRVLDELVVGDLEVRGSLALSYDALDERARRALRRLGWLGTSDFAPWVLAVLLDVPVPDAEDVVDELVHAQLLDVVGGGRFRPHDLTRIFAWERAEAEEDRDALAATATRVAEVCLLLVERASGGTPMKTLRPARSAAPAQSRRWEGLGWFALPARPVNWLDVEQGTLVHVVERVGELDLADVATRLATALCSSSFAVENRFHHWWRAHTAALESARRAGDLAGQALLLSGLGWLRSEQDRLDEAIDYYRQALDLHDRAEDGPAASVTRLLLASVQRERGDLVDALATLDRVMGTLVDPRALTRAHHGRGMTLLELGDVAGARPELDRALAGYAELRDAHGVALVRRSLSLAHRAEGRWEDAAREGEEALRGLESAGDRLMVAYGTQSLAKVRIRQGRGEEVREALGRALDMCHGMQDGFGEALVLRTLGELELAVGAPAEAVVLLGRAIDWWESLSLPLWRARTQRDLATALAAVGATAESDAAYEQAHRAFTRHRSREAREPRPAVARDPAARHA
ncbi:BTAD domain-containing putative transcriptional regulator [Umezawaea sp. Da 62-37]|uniref:AfsR/SARP family transcriptional regulator n=1 Tax=Umezawaea sp. Da 62-37 TaxID=3075927 RepID=UPI0028F6D664|nr:BTAD domain-containing putative transcriptional regulator [Umezawaea sp. Da 62-37]WNV86473.1 BTAD domain-containing putative transcriptional regulator [Umezawaea sp. Da 62-37]